MTLDYPELPLGVKLWHIASRNPFRDGRQFIFALAMRFIPTLYADLTIISEAQKARGFDPAKLGIVERLKRLTTYVVPLLSISFRRADTISVALESRAFTVKKNSNRTGYRQIGLNGGDRLIVASFVGLLVLTLVLRFVFGWFVIVLQQL